VPVKNGKTKLAPGDKTGRSKGEGQYAPLSYAMLQSAAWRSLSGASARVFLELRTRFHGTNNGALTLSTDEGRRLLGLGKTTVQRALVELQDKGLIVCTRKGQWYGRIASTWAVTDRPMMGATVATNAWKAWRQSPDEKTNPRSCSGPVAPNPRSCSGPVSAVLGPVADPSAPNPRSCSGPLILEALIKGAVVTSKIHLASGGRSEPRARGRHGPAAAHAPDTITDDGGTP
jgi:hypothetical protein